VALVAGPASASANFSGAIYTTEADCTTVNNNIYDDKEAVYLNGGPQNNATAAALPGDTTFYVKVTTPDDDPLSGIDSPPTVKSDADGNLPCTQLWALLTKYSDGTQGYDDTTNSGGVYKVWVSTESDFPNSAAKTDNFKVVVPPPEPLAVEKTASPSFDRTYAWNVSKGVDKTIVKQVGGSATFNYTITVGQAQGSPTDGNWMVGGDITITNPNTDDVTGVDLTDAVDNGGTCAVTNGTGLTVPGTSSQSNSVTRSYTCTYDSAPSPASGTNTATASWPDNELSNGTLAAGSATGSADFDFGAVNPKEIDDCISVSDSYQGSLGTACVADAPKSFTYSRTIQVPANDCQSYPNTATFTTDDTGATGSASQTVTVCGPAKTGALTIGFWKTTNGQNLVKTYCNNGSNNLGTYLAGLGAGSGPFSNAPTSCSSLATYVYNILNGASATDMNKMLKAQMLGTALDVWFSGPGWTSTKTGGVKPPSNFLSHNSLGSFNMDTTAVCPMVDNLSTGTATCKNNTPSTDAVAGGAVPSSPMAMQAILDYAATTPSPFNGSTSSGNWYAGSRTKQEILKNIYDQFNNQLAFGSF
jgi:hypothetical protein